MFFFFIYYILLYFFFFFFFQAEDGIRDIGVTGVQTCALPISPGRGGHLRGAASAPAGDARRPSRRAAPRREPHPLGPAPHPRHHLPRRGVNEGARISNSEVT